jgi:hypothetical protein
VAAWLGFGVGAAMVAVLDADAPKPPPASSVPLPEGWSVVDDRPCDAKNCGTRQLVVEAPAGTEVTPPARRLIASLTAAGWRVDADTPAQAESDDGITVDAAPPPPAPEPVAEAPAPPTTVVAKAASTTTAPSTTAPATTTTVPAAVAANRATITVGFRSDAAGRAYHREGIAMQHIKGFYRILAVLTAATVGLGFLLFVLDQFVS